MRWCGDAQYYAEGNGAVAGVFLFLPGDVQGGFAAFGAGDRVFLCGAGGGDLAAGAEYPGHYPDGCRHSGHLYFKADHQAEPFGALPDRGDLVRLCGRPAFLSVPFVFDHIFQPYQVKRIYDAIGKDYVPKDQATEAALENEQKTSGKKKDNNYNVKQSKIAIGSGGLIGKGLLKGTQTRYDFVPEQKTDFIFCTIGEGFGFIGSMLFLGIYILLLMRIVTIAERQRSVFSRCYAYGVGSVLFFSYRPLTSCMTIGLAPVIGIPLPFVSYGGTSLLTFSIMLFIMVRLDADRQMVLR